MLKLERVRRLKKQVYGRRDGRAMVGHSLVFCAMGLIRTPLKSAQIYHRLCRFLGLRPTFAGAKVAEIVAR
jgi:hypothetical protein